MKNIVMGALALSLVAMSPALATDQNDNRFSSFGAFGTFGSAAASSAFGGEARSYAEGEAGVERLTGNRTGVVGWQVNDAGAMTLGNAWADGRSIGGAVGGFVERAPRGNRGHNGR